MQKLMLDERLNLMRYDYDNTPSITELFYYKILVVSDYFSYLSPHLLLSYYIFSYYIYSIIVIQPLIRDTM